MSADTRGRVSLREYSVAQIPHAVYVTSLHFIMQATPDDPTAKTKVRHATSPVYVISLQRNYD